MVERATNLNVCQAKSLLFSNAEYGFLNGCSSWNIRLVYLGLVQITEKCLNDLNFSLHFITGKSKFG